MTTFNEKDLIAVAAAAREKAYAPYSSFKVGAALFGTGGETFAGCNIENVSFGLTMCAERVALGAAIQGGIADFEAIAIVSDSHEPVVPCGACRQVLAEFAPALKVYSANLTGQVTEFSLSILLPSPRQGILG